MQCTQPEHNFTLQTKPAARFVVFQIIKILITWKTTYFIIIIIIIIIIVYSTHV
jgi:hypothetical protein